MINASFNTIREQGFRVLVEGLGTVGAINFLRQFESGSGDYTAEREKLHGDVTIDDIAARIQKRQERVKPTL
ncbi:hypothetical protein C4J81_19050 (plasmid) [Deltaproteobacteria bacterium Smac51]|nr:hypothetical protein C4J81_19050 [Deltaproteobacteria bacterium Smac51]